MASVSATSSAIIHVLDKNDNAPYFTQQLYKGEISESAPIASLILAVNDTMKMDQRYVMIKLKMDLYIERVKMATEHIKTEQTEYELSRFVSLSLCENPSHRFNQ